MRVTKGEALASPRVDSRVNSLYRLRRPTREHPRGISSSPPPCAGEPPTRAELLRGGRRSRCAETRFDRSEGARSRPVAVPTPPSQASTTPPSPRGHDFRGKTGDSLRRDCEDATVSWPPASLRVGEAPSLERAGGKRPAAAKMGVKANRLDAVDRSGGQALPRESEMSASCGPKSRENNPGA